LTFCAAIPPGESTYLLHIKDAAPPSRVPATGTRSAEGGDITNTLPAGIQGPFFNDEFGDVYTNIYAGKETGFRSRSCMTMRRLRTELLRVPEVNKVDFIADQEQRVYVELRIAQLPSSPDATTDRDAVDCRMPLPDRASSRPARPGLCPANRAVTDIDATQRHSDPRQRRVFRLGDIATIRRGYVEPATQYMRFQRPVVLVSDHDGRPRAMFIALGKALDAETARCAPALPRTQAHPGSQYACGGGHSVDDFVEAVAEAIGIVWLSHS